MFLMLWLAVVIGLKCFQSRMLWLGGFFKVSFAVARCSSPSGVKMLVEFSVLVLYCLTC